VPLIANERAFGLLTFVTAESGRRYLPARSLQGGRPIKKLYDAP
jgi:hypothetical protein